MTIDKIIQENKIRTLQFIVKVNALPNTGWVLGYREFALYVEEGKSKVGSLPNATIYHEKMASFTNKQGLVAQWVHIRDAKDEAIALVHRAHSTLVEALNKKR